VAALPGLLSRGEIRPDERVVCLLSGAGFKDAHLAEAEAEAIHRREPVPFEVEAIAQQARRGSNDLAHLAENIRD
jgi:threonine synthase